MRIKSIIKKILPRSVINWVYKKKKSLQIAFAYRRIKNVTTHSNDKPVILFIVQRTEVFNSVRTIFEEAVNSKSCDVYLLPLPRACSSEAGQIIKTDTFELVRQFCLNLNKGNVIETYNKNDNTYFDLSQLNIDYIFLNVPYSNQYPDEYSFEKLAQFGKICFVPYGYTLGNITKYLDVYKTEFNDDLLKNASFIFSDSRATYEFCKKNLWISEIISGKRLFNFGFPRFDTIVTSKSNQIFTALWIPRWTTSSQSSFFSSSFFEFKDIILDFFSHKSKECRLITRPHPIAFDNYVKEGIMSQDDVSEYKSRFTGNLYLDEEADYLNSFSKADVLIADFSSIIIEYFITGKPIIYCGTSNDFAKENKYITDTFYFASNWDDVQTVLKELLKGNDTLKDKRTRALDKFKSSTTHSGKRILGHLIKDHSRN